jgi:hypothetical protein
MPDLAIKNEAAADSGPHRQEAKMLHIPARPNPFFTQSRRVRIVLKKEGTVQAFCNLGTNIEVLPAWQIGRCHENAVLHADDARNANTNSSQLVAVLPAIDQFEYSAREPIDNILAAPLNQGFQT